MRMLVKIALTSAFVTAGILGYLGFADHATQIDGQHDASTPLAQATVRIPEANYVARMDVARSATERERGLSGRASLPADRGMLFVFDQPGYYGIWMKEMRFPLDLIWVAGGVVVDRSERLPVPPKGAKNTDLKITLPTSPALVVLEVPSGTIARQKIRVGQHVEVAFDGR